MKMAVGIWGWSPKSSGAVRSAARSGVCPPGEPTRLVVLARLQEVRYKRERLTQERPAAEAWTAKRGPAGTKARAADSGGPEDRGCSSSTKICRLTGSCCKAARLCRRETRDANAFLVEWEEGESGNTAMSRRARAPLETTRSRRAEAGSRSTGGSFNQPGKWDERCSADGEDGPTVGAATKTPEACGCRTIAAARARLGSRAK